MEQQSRSEVRHAIRGALNALKLCVFALEMPLTESDKLGFLSDVEFSADRLAELVAEFETSPEEPGPLPDEIPVARPVSSPSSDVLSRSV
jgi:hypothetical protein